MSFKHVAALAGRRVDPPNSVPERFPLANISSVRAKIRQVFISEKIDFLVCAAAAGADLIALEEASKLKIQYKIVLPLDPAKFRAASVADRPGEWGSIFDAEMAKARDLKNLVVLEPQSDNDEAFYHATEVILKEANAAAAPEKAIAILVWDGHSRSSDDFSLLFRTRAANFGMREREILTR